jgi:hypothetical protein
MPRCSRRTTSPRSVNRPGRRARPRFDRDAWEEDLARTTASGRAAAEGGRGVRAAGDPDCTAPPRCRARARRNRASGLREGLPPAARRPVRNGVRTQARFRRSSGTDLPRVRRPTPPSRRSECDRLPARPPPNAWQGAAKLNARCNPCPEICPELGKSDPADARPTCLKRPQNGATCRQAPPAKPKVEGPILSRPIGRPIRRAAAS